MSQPLKAKVEIPLEAISQIFKGIERLEIELEAYRLTFEALKLAHAPDAASLDASQDVSRKSPPLLEKINQKYHAIQEMIVQTRHWRSRSEND